MNSVQENEADNIDLSSLFGRKGGKPMCFKVKLDGRMWGRVGNRGQKGLTLSLSVVLLNEIISAFFLRLDFLSHCYSLGSPHLDGIVSKATHYLLIVIL